VNWRPRAVYLTYRSLAGALQVFPDPVAELIATTAGWTMSHVWRGKRSLLRRNLGRVLGAAASPLVVDEYVRRSFDSYARYWVESARVGKLPSEKLHEDFKLDGYEHIVEAAKAGKGVILALPHLGNWEHGGRWMAEKGHRIAAVAEVLEPPELFEWFLAQRAQLGMEIIPLREGTSSAVLRVLAAGGVVCLLADRDLAGNGIELEFFGEVTTLPAGPAMLALRSGAALITCAVYHYRGGHHSGIVNPPLDTTRTGSLRADVARLTEQIARDMEDLIRRAPDQWHLFVPNWPSDRGPA
jgi:lauroyl/myristoyl acyltransferase